MFSDPADSAEFYENIFLLYGAAETYWIPVYEGNEGAAIDPNVVDQVNQAYQWLKVKT